MPNGYPYRAQRLRADCNTANFNCGVASLNSFLLGAMAEIDLGLTTVYVYEEEGLVLGYFALSGWNIKKSEATAAVSAGPYRSIPASLLARLAVDLRVKGRGLGSSLLKEAVHRAIDGSRIVASRAMVVHAEDQSLVPFYTRFGFEAAHPIKLPLYLMANLSVLASRFG